MYYIVNTSDRPYPRHVCQQIGDRIYYMEPELFPRFQEGFSLQGATSLLEFGFDWVELGGRVLFAQLRPSVAQYKEGSPRYWQGEKEFILTKLKTKEQPYV